MEIDFKRSKRRHWHCVKYLNDGTVQIVLPLEDAKELYYSCLVNREKSSIFEDVAKLLNSFV